MDQQTAKPLIYVPNPLTSSSSAQSGFTSKIKKNLAKIIFALFGVIILGELFIGFKTLTSPSNFQASKIYPISDAKLVVDSARTTYQVGDTIPVKIRVVTGGRPTDSTDLVLHYDKAILEPLSNDITVGKFYDDYPIAEADQTNGVVQISGLTAIGKEGFSGVGELATINFKAIKEGNAKLTVDFNPGATNESNVVLSNSSKDIIGQVFNLDLTIVQKGAKVDLSSNQAGKCDGYFQYCQTTDGKVGKQFCRSGKKQNNECVFDNKFTNSCDPCNTK